MGTCCQAHLATMIRDYAKNAQNGAVTVIVIENPPVAWRWNDERKSLDVYEGCACDYCRAMAEFTCSYYPQGQGTQTMKAE